MAESQKTVKVLDVFAEKQKRSRIAGTRMIVKCCERRVLFLLVQELKPIRDAEGMSFSF